MIFEPNLNERNTIDQPAEVSNPVFIFGSSSGLPLKMSGGNYPLAFRCIFCKEEFSMYIEYVGEKRVLFCPFCGRKGLREAEY